MMERRRMLLMDSIKEFTVTGNPALFNTNIVKPLKSLIMPFTPIQASGTPSPANPLPITGWTGCNVARTGKNLLSKAFEHYSNVSTDLSNYFWIKAGTYILSFDSSTATYWRYIARLKDRDGNVLSDNAHNPSSNLAYRSTLYGYTNGLNVNYKSIILNIVEDCYARFLFWNTTNGANDSFSGVRLELGTSITAYQPYIGQTYPVTWQTEAGTVYGGTVNPVTGNLIVTDAEIASYNGETLPSTWISDRDVYAEGTTPTIGAQVVYKLAIPLEYDIQSITIDPLLDDNIIYSDTNGINTITYLKR